MTVFTRSAKGSNCFMSKSDNLLIALKGIFAKLDYPRQYLEELQ